MLRLPPSLPAALALRVPDGRTPKEGGRDGQRVSGGRPCSLHPLPTFRRRRRRPPLRGLTVQSGARVEERPSSGIVVAKLADPQKNLRMSDKDRSRLMQ